MTSNRIIPLPAGKHFSGFSLDIENPDINLLADENEIIVNTKTGHYMLINWDTRYVAADGTFEPEELPLVLSLLEAWPTYVPIEKLLLATTHLTIEEINQALEESTRDRMLLNLRYGIAECLQRVHPLGIDIQDISGLGYKLSRYHTRE